jgi:hypothetical protein
VRVTVTQDTPFGFSSRHLARSTDRCKSRPGAHPACARALPFPSDSFATPLGDGVPNFEVRPEAAKMPSLKVNR